LAWLRARPQRELKSVEHLGASKWNSPLISQTRWAEPEAASQSSSQNHLRLSSPLGIVQRDSFMALVRRNGFKSTKRQKPLFFDRSPAAMPPQSSCDLCIEGKTLRSRGSAFCFSRCCGEMAGDASCAVQ